MEQNIENTDSSKPLIFRGLGRLPNWLKNKYLIAGVAFLTMLMFFDDNNLFLQYDRKKRLNELKRTEKHLTSEIATTNTELKLLKTSAETIEKYAREKYLMKKDNEDLFVIQPSAK